VIALGYISIREIFRIDHSISHNHPFQQLQQQYISLSVTLELPSLLIKPNEHTHTISLYIPLSHSKMQFSSIFSAALVASVVSAQVSSRPFK
jgi:hypothetical protein